MLQVSFYGLLRMALQRESLEIPWREGDTMARVLERVEEAISAPLKLLDEAGVPHQGTIILVNGRNIHYLSGLETPVQAGDVIALFPAAAGG
jgi:sulfur-carrier protein